MKKWRSETLFEKIIIGICSLIGMAAPYLGIVSFSAIFGDGFTIETALFFSLFLLSLLSIHYVAKAIDIIGGLERRKNSLEIGRASCRERV
mgnify:CR=1 FL=1